MKILLRAVAAVLLGSVLSLCGDVDARPTPTAGYVNVMPLGDSITFGLTKVNGHNYYSDGYRKDLWVRLRNVGVNVNMVGSCPDAPAGCPAGNTGFGDYNHEGHAGYSTAQLHPIGPANAATYAAHAVLLLTGANDLRLNRTPTQYLADLTRLVDEIHLARPAAFIFVASPTFKSGEPDWDDYAQVAAAVANARPTYTKFVPLHIVGQKAGELVDGVHPSLCGYARIAYVWYYYIERSPLNVTGAAWPTGYYPFNSPATGVCAGIP